MYDLYDIPFRRTLFVQLSPPHNQAGLFLLTQTDTSYILPPC